MQRRDRNEWSGERNRRIQRGEAPKGGYLGEAGDTGAIDVAGGSKGGEALSRVNGIEAGAIDEGMDFGTDKLVLSIKQTDAGGEAMSLFVHVIKLCVAVEELF